MMLCVQEKSQSLDMNAEAWTGLPLIKEAEREKSSGSEDERAGQREGEQQDGEGERGLMEESYDDDEWAQGVGDGWEEQLIQRGGGEEADGGMWGEDTPREAEQEEEEDEEEEKGTEGRLRRYTNEGWEERYVGPEGEEPLEITPAPLIQREDELGASHNSLDLVNQDEAEPVAPETEDDDKQHLYAKIPETHKAKKRIKMMKEAQKQERKARKLKRKMEKKEEKTRRKAMEKERKERGKQQKTGVVKLQEEMGLGDAMRLQDVDTSTVAGRAQAQFIDAATAPFF